MDSHFYLLHNIPLPAHVVHALLVGVVLIFSAWLFKYKYKGEVLPDSRLSFTGFFEVLVEKLYDFFGQTFGKKQARTYLHILGSVFLFILLSNLLGLIPGFLPPTDNLNTNYAVAITIFVLYNYYGLKEHGLGYIKQFTGPILLMAPLIFCIELVGHAIRPLSLSLRLFGNITGDHQLLGAFSNLAPVLIPIVFMLLGLLVAFVQALVFTILSAVYINLAVSHDH